MPRDNIGIKVANGSVNPASGDDLEFAFTAGVAVNNLQWIAQIGDVLLLENNAVGAGQATLVAVDDEQGRSENIVISLAAGEKAHFGPLQNLLPWAQSDGNFHVDIDTDDIDAAVLRTAGKL